MCVRLCVCYCLSECRDVPMSVRVCACARVCMCASVCLRCCMSMSLWVQGCANVCAHACALVCAHVCTWASVSLSGYGLLWGAGAFLSSCPKRAGSEASTGQPNPALLQASWRRSPHTTLAALRCVGNTGVMIAFIKSRVCRVIISPWVSSSWSSGSSAGVALDIHGIFVTSRGNFLFFY